MNKNKVLNDIINGRTNFSSVQYNSPQFIGSISKIFNENRFRNFDEYKRYYTKNILSLKELRSFSERIYQEIGCNFDVSTEEIYQYLESLIFEKSWDGFINRINKAILYLEKNGFENIRTSSEEIDSRYAIDLFSDKDGKRYIIQVKPKSFLSEYYKYHYVQNLKKNLKFLTDNPKGHLVLYLFEHKGVFTCKLFNKKLLEDEINANS